MQHYEVAVDAPMAQTLTYGHPRDQQDPVPVGSCVVVPLGRRRVTGYVLGTSPLTDPATDTFVVKPINRVFAPAPLFPEWLIPLYRWLAAYYHHPLGQVIKTALPVAPTARSGLRASLTAMGIAQLAETRPEELSPGRHPWLESLRNDRQLTAAKVAQLWRDPSEKRKLQQLAEQGWLELVPELVTSQLKEKKETAYTLAAAFDSLHELEPAEIPQELSPADGGGEGVRLKPSEQKTLLYFLELCRQGPKAPVARRSLLEVYRNCGKALVALCEQGVLVKERLRIYRDPFGGREIAAEPPLQLTPEQQEVLSAVIPAIDQGSFSPFLLHGVTGCGKTEVYLRAVAAALEQGKSALVLVPEIALAAQLEAQFYARFGEQLAIFHSGLSQGERFDQWLKVWNRRSRVVLGARSAVFAPLDDLGVIIVDEEHEPAYKQEEGARYHGRDVAVMRAKMASCPVVLGSATPAVTSFNNACQGKYRLLTMARRVENQPLPEVQVVDLAREKRSRPDLFFSDQLISAIHQTLDNNQQVLLYVNRRGFSSAMLCRDCGHVLQCSHCQVSLTHHRSSDKLLCHYCGFTLHTNIVCPGCNSTKVSGIGLGTEKIEEEARQLFASARVARLDSDTAVKRKNYLATLQAVRNRQVDILVGTQMIAKGLHFPAITLVGVVSADAGLAIPDYKAAERTFSLLSQVTGRAGRGEYSGKVIVQTYQPQHYAIRFARDHDYQALYDQEITTRSLLGFPPFSRLVNLRFSGVEEKKVELAAQKIARLIRDEHGQTGIELLGPAPAPLSRIKDRFRWQLLMKSTNGRQLHDICGRLAAGQRQLRLGAVRLGIDVDPENMM